MACGCGSKWGAVDPRTPARQTLTGGFFANAQRAVKQGYTPYLGIWTRAIVSVVAVVPTYAGRIQQNPRYLNQGHPVMGSLDTGPDFGAFNG